MVMSSQHAHDLLDALGRGDEDEQVDVLGALLAQQLDRGRRRATRREHRVDDEHVALGDVVGELAVVLDRLERHRVAVQADVAHARRRDELEDAVDHARDRRAGSG